MVMILRMMIVFAICAVEPAAAGYSVQALGVDAEHDASYATDINESGAVLCGSMSASDAAGTFLWSRDTGIVGLTGEGVFSSAGINSNGQTVGLHMYVPFPGSWLRYELFIRNADGSTTALPVPDDASDVWPAKIDDAGRVWVDLEYRDPSGTIKPANSAVISPDGSVEYIGNTWVHAISNNGTAIIDYRYLRTPQGELSVLPWLENAGAVDVTCVNDLGWVAGILLGGHVVRWDSAGNMLDLGVGFAGGMNNLGQVVGSMNDRAVMWDVDGSVTELPSLDGRPNSGAGAINDRGQIAGRACAESPSTEVAVLWDPVPEPSALMTLTCGLVGAGLGARRRSRH